jgi:hypothetical protein
VRIAQPIPGRNLYALTDQLKLRPPRTIPKVVRTASPNYKVGHQDTFEILAEDNNKYFTTKATIRAVTPHLYVYVQNGVKFNLAAVQRSVQLFEHRTYPTNHRYFGTEWMPGVDGDPHITCLIADLKSSSAIGYFSAEDEYPRLVNPFSNQREMVYLNAVMTLPGDNTFNVTLSHEFQHMIHWHMHPHDNGWLNEGMSMVAEKLNTYEPSPEEDAFLGLPQTQLNSWAESGPTSLSHYGAAYFYLSYLYNHYGTGLLHDMLATPRYTDLELVNATLQKRHIPITADDVFARWVVANAIRDPHVAGGIYDYANLPSKVTMPSPRKTPFDDAEKLAPYTAQYVPIDLPSGTRPFTLHFTAPVGVPVVGVTKSPPFWWSNRGDMSDTRLVRSFDLQHVRHATLHFNAWYDIEKDYDYGYVEASRDGGKTWTTLQAGTTTAADPYGASYGNAFTGKSKGWHAETVNLSSYAGHKIMLRFEYITDDVFTGQGLLLQGMSIPEIGFHDNYTGWKQQGFVPIFANSLPANWHVQLIEYTKNSTQVRSLPLTAGSGGNFTASLKIDPTKTGVQKLIAVVFYTAPKTTVQLPWHLSAAKG